MMEFTDTVPRWGRGERMADETIAYAVVPGSSPDRAWSFHARGQVVLTLNTAAGGDIARLVLDAVASATNAAYQNQVASNIAGLMNRTDIGTDEFAIGNADWSPRLIRDIDAVTEGTRLLHMFGSRVAFQRPVRGPRLPGGKPTLSAGLRVSVVAEKRPNNSGTETDVCFVVSTRDKDDQLVGQVQLTPRAAVLFAVGSLQMLRQSLGPATATEHVYRATRILQGDAGTALNQIAVDPLQSAPKMV